MESYTWKMIPESYRWHLTNVNDDDDDNDDNDNDDGDNDDEQQEKIH